MMRTAHCSDEARLIGRETLHISHGTEDDILSLSQVSHSHLNNIWSMLRQPAFILNAHGLVVDMNSEANAILDDEIMISGGQICLADIHARTKTQHLIEQLAAKSTQAAHSAEPIVVRRPNKCPIILRLWPIQPGECQCFHHVHALVTLTVLGPRPGPTGANLAQIFGLTPAEARLACIIARGAAPAIAAKELGIAYGTARNQLKSIFVKTGTHRQSELVSLLTQVP